MRQPPKSPSQIVNAQSPACVPSEDCLSSITVSDSEPDNEETTEALELPEDDNEPEDAFLGMDVDEMSQNPSWDVLEKHQGLDHKQHLSSTSAGAASPDEPTRYSPSERIPSVPVSPVSLAEDHQRNLAETGGSNEPILISSPTSDVIVQQANEGRDNTGYKSLINLTPLATDSHGQSSNSEDAHHSRLSVSSILSPTEQQDQYIGAGGNMGSPPLMEQPPEEKEQQTNPVSDFAVAIPIPSTISSPLERQQQRSHDESDGSPEPVILIKPIPPIREGQQNSNTRMPAPLTLSQTAGALGLINSPDKIASQPSGAGPQSSSNGTRMTQGKPTKLASAAMAASDAAREKLLGEYAASSIRELDRLGQHAANNHLRPRPFPPMDVPPLCAGAQYQTGTPWIPGGTQHPQTTAMQPYRRTYSSSSSHPIGTPASPVRQNTVPPSPRPGSLATNYPPVSYQPHQPGGSEYRGSPISMPTPPNNSSSTSISTSHPQNRATEQNNGIPQVKELRWIREHLTLKSFETTRLLVQRNERGTYACPYCPKEYPRFLVLETHMTRKHQDERPLRPPSEVR